MLNGFACYKIYLIACRFPESLAKRLSFVARNEFFVEPLVASDLHDVSSYFCIFVVVYRKCALETFTFCCYVSIDDAGLLQLAFFL